MTTHQSKGKPPLFPALPEIEKKERRMRDKTTAAIEVINILKPRARGKRKENLDER